MQAVEILVEIGGEAVGSCIVQVVDTPEVFEEVDSRMK